MAPGTGKKIIRINLLSSPRNISTALMYSFANRGDAAVVDEPFYGYYLAYSGADHPGRDEIMASMATDSDIVIRSVIQGDYPRPLVFFKNMAHHLTGFDVSFLEGLVNVFLIRDPRQLITSFAKIIANPTMRDIGMARQWELFSHLHAATGKPPIVLDSGEVLVNPALVLSELCREIGIPFSRKMLRWAPGALPEDGVWAKFWYASVHRSSGFSPQYTQEHTLPLQCRALYEEALPVYKQFYHYAIRA